MNGGAALAATVVAAALLGGCAAVPVVPATTLSGRMSLQVAADAGRAAQSLSAGFELAGGDRTGELRLFGPLGATLAAARWSPGEASLETADGTRRFSSLEELAREALGEPVPLAALPDWLAGRPWPGAGSVPTAAGFEQLGWRVDLAGQAEGRIGARRDAPPAVTLRVRLDPPETRGGTP